MATPLYDVCDPRAPPIPPLPSLEELPDLPAEFQLELEFPEPVSSSAAPLPNIATGKVSLVIDRNKPIEDLSGDAWTDILTLSSVASIRPTVQPPRKRAFRARTPDRPASLKRLLPPEYHVTMEDMNAMKVKSTAFINLTHVVAAHRQIDFREAKKLLYIEKRRIAACLAKRKQYLKREAAGDPTTASR